MPADCPGYVYVAFNPETGLCKLGYSKNPGERERALGIEFAAKVRLLHTILSNWPGRLETHLHRYFAAKRVAGEWFDLSVEDIRLIQGVSSVVYKCKGRSLVGSRAEHESEVAKRRRGFRGYPVCEGDIQLVNTSRRCHARRSGSSA